MTKRRKRRKGEESTASGEYPVNGRDGGEAELAASAAGDSTCASTGAAFSTGFSTLSATAAPVAR